MKIIAFCGSMRSHAGNRDIILRIAKESRDIDNYINRTTVEMNKGCRLCNSEIMAGAGLSGANSIGAEIDYFPLIELFPEKDEKVFQLSSNSEVEQKSQIDSLAVDKAKIDLLLEKISESDGIYLATPVYFGDRSSVANKLLQITGIHNILKDKIFGVASVGAKRNGGQETTNIFSMYEALHQDAMVVGNGPPTSQYGGTAVSGNAGRIIEDHQGLSSSFDTGKKVSHVSDIYKRGGEIWSAAGEEKDVKITVLVTMDTHGRMLRKYLSNLIGKVRKDLPWVEFEFIELIDFIIYRCLGCNKCPVPTGRGDTDSENGFGCIIRDPDDAMEVIRKSMRQSDGILVAGANIHDSQNIVFRYQVSMERMRFIRRNNYELTNISIASLSYNQVGATVNPIHSLKVQTSFVRHNTIIHRPVEILEHEGKIIKTGKNEMLRFCQNVRCLSVGRKKVKKLPSAYVAKGIGGY